MSIHLFWNFCAERLDRSEERVVVALRAAAGEDDLLRLAAQEAGDLGARGLHVGGDGAAERVHAGGVAVALREEREHRLDDLRRAPGRRVVVEVVDGFRVAHGARGG